MSRRPIFPAVLFAVLGLFVTALVAQDTLPPKTPAGVKTSKDQMSYVVGLDIGANLSDSEVDLDIELVLKGIRDALGRAKPSLSNEQIQEALQEFNRLAQVKAQARLKALGDKNKKDGEAFLAENKKKKEINTLPSGLQVQFLKSGKGATPKKNDVVKVHYKGTFIDGTVFDSSLENPKPAEFPVDQVIAGWTEALLRMKVGDKWKLFVPAELAYGERGSPPYIGPNALLVFEVELLDITPPSSSSPPSGK